jgi:N-acetylglucosaminyldiphosphoundecaprenol N-acetyl-beta-D-mannosaminyltransferase
VRFDAITRQQAAMSVVQLAKSDGKAYVVKPYSEFMPPAHRDPQIRQLLNDAALCIPDGAGILWAAHYLSLKGGRVRALLQLPLSLGSLVFRPEQLGGPLPEAMHGVDFTWEMLTAIADAGLSVYLLGGTAQESDGAAREIAARLPALRIAGARPGYLKDAAGVLGEVNAARPDVLLVGMGFPRQEKWIAEHLQQLAVGVAVAEGGSFTFMSGAIARAPRWMRRSGLEWLYRLLRQPSRLRRQLALPVFVWLVLRERLRAA